MVCLIVTAPIDSLKYGWPFSQSIDHNTIAKHSSNFITFFIFYDGYLCIDFTSQLA